MASTLPTPHGARRATHPLAPRGAAVARALARVPGRGFSGNRGQPARRQRTRVRTPGRAAAAQDHPPSFPSATASPASRATPTIRGPGHREAHAALPSRRPRESERTDSARLLCHSDASPLAALRHSYRDRPLRVYQKVDLLIEPATADPCRGPEPGGP